MSNAIPESDPTVTTEIPTEQPTSTGDTIPAASAAPDFEALAAILTDIKAKYAASTAAADAEAAAHDEFNEAKLEASHIILTAQEDLNAKAAANVEAHNAVGAAIESFEKALEALKK